MANRKVVRCYYKTFGDFVSAYSSNMAGGGIYIASPEAVAEGEQVRFEFKLRNDYPLIMGYGLITGMQPAEGFTLVFSQLDADSEKFLNEVVKVKAAELQGNAAPVEFDTEITEEPDQADALELMDTGEFGNTEIEELAPGAPADPFGDFDTGDAQTAPSAEFDFSDVPIGEDVGTDAGDQFGDLDGAGGAAPADEFAVAGDGPAGYEESDLPDDDYEDVEQTAANPAALFEDIGEPEDTPAFAPPAEAGEATVGGSTTIFERISTLKERKALLVGVGVGVLALGLGGAGWFMFAPTGTTAPVAAVQPPPIETADPVTAPASAPAQAVAAASATAAADVAAAPEAVAPEPQPAPVAATPPPPPPSPQPVAVAKPAPPPAPVRRAMGPAGKVVAVEALADGAVVIRGDGDIGKYKYFSMSGPNRIVVDVYGVAKGFAGHQVAGNRAVARVRPGVHKGKVRFVLDLAKESGRMPGYDVVQDAERITVRLR